MRSVLACLLVLALLPAFAGVAAFAQQKNEEAELWRVRSQGITDDLLKDASQLSSTRRAVLVARLAQQWWANDQGRARTWFRNAIDVVEQVPNKETAAERQERLSTARLLLKFVAPIDKKLAAPLVKILNAVDEQSTNTERTNNADALIDSALALIEQDPQRAAELGALAIRLGPPSDIASLLLAMRQQNYKLADALFIQALSAARQNSFHVQTLNSLSYAAFPGQRGSGDRKLAAPDYLRAQLLQLDVAFLNANPINPETEGSVCWCVSGFIAPVLSEFERLVPQGAEVVRQAIYKCQAANPAIKQQVDLSSNSQPLNTVEALLDASKDTTNDQIRTVYEYRAANLAIQNKDYELAIKILDNMSKEGRKLMDEAWIWYRVDWAAGVALEHYQHGRLFEMNLVLNAVPPDLQPLAKAVFVDRLPENKNPETDPTVQLLNDAKTGLRRANIRESDRYGCYFVLLRSVIKYQPSEAGAILKEAIASLNRFEQANKDRKTLNTPEFSKAIPASLLEMDEFAVKEGIASIATVETRAQLRLQLLEASLERMKLAR
jgi:hypothetical protein